MKNNEKRICWNCDGEVSLHLTDCLYCGTNLGAPPGQKASKELGDPFQSAPNNSTDSISKQDWEQALDTTSNEKLTHLQTKREFIALLLLLPGIVFCLFGLLLIFFSRDGTLILQWNKNLAYCYFLGAMPMIFLGWRLISKQNS